MSYFDCLFQENKTYGSKNHLHSSSDVHKSRVRHRMANWMERGMVEGWIEGRIDDEQGNGKVNK